jgi:hypothetical protein
VTAFGILLTPVFYYVLRWFDDRPADKRPDAERPPASAGTAPGDDGSGELPAPPETGIQARPSANTP